MPTTLGISNFRVVLREGELIVIFPWGSEWPLVPLPDVGFRLGSEEWWPERLRFDAIVDGAALRVDVERRGVLPRPLDVVARKPVRPGPREDARVTARRPRA